jgi:leucyl aminopeptidase
LTRVSKEKRVEFTIKAGSPEKLKNGCVVAGVAGGELSAAALALDEACDGAISTILGRGELDDKAGATLMLHALPGLATPRVLLVSLGKRDELSDKAYRDAVAAAAKQLAGSVAATPPSALPRSSSPSATWPGASPRPPRSSRTAPTAATSSSRRRKNRKGRAQARLRRQEQGR